MNVLTVTILLALAATASAQTQAPARTDLVKAELLADVESVKAGQPFTVGVLLKIKPHWHIYWKNPGDSGMPTKVKWNLPEGFQAGELQFPIPVRFDQPGDVIGYGYSDEVLLTTQVTPPNNLPSGTPIEISADAAWLVCEEVCIPGKGTPKLSLAVTDSTPAPANVQLFERYRSQLPTRINASGEAVKQTRVIASPDENTVVVEWASPATDVQWFPVPPEENGVEDMQTRTEGGVSTMTFSLSPAPKGPADMQFLVAYTDSSGNRQGVEFEVKLPPPAK